ncbi:hypothetical protein LCGC14_1410640 [marine sediment metagenome]|uniref:Uncharacterized protein n=1 Tax=marine sediment metagenome TaxID=412755 RepID=A0A0F9MW26_9ZZZZ
MAIIRTGPLVGGISGKIGGVVFVNARRGLVARPAPRVTRPSSPFLQRSKARMHNLRRHWATLTALQQDLWNTAARDVLSTNRIGLSSPMTGFTYFIKTNKVAFPGTFSIVDEPESLLSRDTPVSPFAAFSAAGAYSVGIANPFTPATLQIQVYGWPFWVDHPTKSVARLVFLKEASEFGLTIVIALNPEWLAHFGPLAEGQRFSVGIKARVSASPFNPLTTIRGVVAA